MGKSVDNNWYLQGGVSTEMLVGGQLSRRSKQLPIRQEPRGDADPLLNTQGWMGLLLYWGPRSDQFVSWLRVSFDRSLAGSVVSRKTLEALGWFSVLFRREFL